MSIRVDTSGTTYAQEIASLHTCNTIYYLMGVLDIEIFRNFLSTRVRTMCPISRTLSQNKRRRRCRSGTDLRLGQLVASDKSQVERMRSEDGPTKP